MQKRSTDGTIDRRRFIRLAGVTGAVGIAGCLGGDEEPSDQGEGEVPDGNDGNGNDGSDESSENNEPAEGDEDHNEFDFPPGAGESGLVKTTVVSGFRQFIEEAERYRIEQQQEFEYSDAPRDRLEVTYDVDGRTAYERLTRNDMEFDRWVTPDRTVSRSIDNERGKSGRWRSETVDGVDRSDGASGYPLAETTVVSLIESASFDFDGIVTEEEQSYARYTGELKDSDRFELRQRRSARIEYRPESVSAGRVSFLLAESGAVRTVEYEFTAEASRVTHEGHEPVEINADGQVQFEYDGLEDRTAPGWAETADSNDVRSFGLTQTSLGQTYRLISGPSLPGTLEQEYSEFYLTATFGDDRYHARYTPRREFNDRSGVVAYLVDGELEMDWASMSGRDALEEADRIEMSVYLRAPGEGRTMVFHEERIP